MSAVRAVSAECKCTRCGCTDSRACSEGCYWILVDRAKRTGICSGCAPFVEKCLAACEGMDDPVNDVRFLQDKAKRYLAIVHARQAPTDGGLQALNICVRKALGAWYGTGGGTRVAQVLCSLYNGDRVKANLWNALGGGIDTDVFEHLLTVFRLHANGGHEIHTYFDRGQPLHDPNLGDGGNAVFERMIKSYGFEKRRRKS